LRFERGKGQSDAAHGSVFFKVNGSSTLSAHLSFKDFFDK
jgi:hypothetical protein